MATNGSAGNQAINKNTKTQTQKTTTLEGGGNRVYNQDGTSYTDYDAQGNFKGAGIAGTENYKAPSGGGGGGGSSFYNNFTNQVNQLYDRQMQTQLEQLRNQRDQAIGDINHQKAQTSTQYQGARNQTDVVNMQNVQRLREVMASAGLTSSGENVTGQVNLANQRQNSLNSLNTQERHTIDNFDRQITNLRNPAQENALIAQLEAERARALLDYGMKADEIGYSRSRDSMMDSRYYDERNYNRGQQQKQWDYQVGRDEVGDKWREKEWDYQAGRDQISDNRWEEQWKYQQEQAKAEKAWREYTFNNMSASEKAQLEWAKAQYGEEAAWRMYQMQYQGELTKSQSQAELDFYKNAGFNETVKGDGWIPNTKDYKITSNYGGRTHPVTGKPDSHRGMDLAVPKGTAIGSTVSGKVVSTKGHSSYGNTVVIQDANGNLHRYAHLDSIGVKVGQTINRGSLIGKSGNTGRSTGAHLHYEVTNAKGALMNPSIFLK